MSDDAYEAAELYLELANIAPTIWRRVRVPLKISLFQLHAVIQCVFQWQDLHMHVFYIDGHAYRDLDQIYDGCGEKYPADEKRVKLSSLFEQGVCEFSYIYDFGDEWRHDIRIGRPSKVDNPKDLLLLLGGDNASPPEDCGGPPGYEHLLKVLSDPEEEEYDELLDWVGGTFDRTMIKKREISTCLGKVRHLYARCWGK